MRQDRGQKRWRVEVFMLPKVRSNICCKPLIALHIDCYIYIYINAHTLLFNLDEDSCSYLYSLFTSIFIPILSFLSTHTYLFDCDGLGFDELLGDLSVLQEAVRVGEKHRLEHLSKIARLVSDCKIEGECEG